MTKIRVIQSEVRHIVVGPVTGKHYEYDPDKMKPADRGYLSVDDRDVPGLLLMARKSSTCCGGGTLETNAYFVR